jgi:hypothetical protein
MTDAPRKPRARTSRLTWAVAVAFLVTAVAGGIWAYFTVGPGRTVDTSGIHQGMKLAQVEEILGRPDEVVVSGDESAWRYGRTHIWFIGVPGVGSIVTDVTNGPRESAGKSNEGPKMKGPPGPGWPKPGDTGK